MDAWWFSVGKCALVVALDVLPSWYRHRVNEKERRPWNLVVAVRDRSTMMLGLLCLVSDVLLATTVVDTASESEPSPSPSRRVALLLTTAVPTMLLVGVDGQSNTPVIYGNTY